MKQETKQKLFFVAGAVFGLALLGASVGIIAAQTTWSPPPGPFPAANVYAPLDTGPEPQEKSGGLILATDPTQFRALFFPESRILTSGSGSLNNLILNAGGEVLLSAEGSFKISAPSGVVLPKLSADPATTAAGSIYYNTTSNSVKLRNSSGWTEIGSGGESHWSMVSGTLTYGGGDVKIASVTQGTQTGFWNTGSIGANGKNTFAFIPKAQAVETGKALACDTSRFYKECPQGTGAFYGGGFKDGSTPTNGSEGTDEFAECPDWSGLQGELNILGSNASCNYYTEEPDGGGRILQHTGYPSYRRMIYEYETRNVGSPTDTATLSVGNISVSGTVDVAKLKMAGLEYAPKSISKSGLGIGIHDMGVKGIVTSFKVNTGGSPGEATTFKILSSTELFKFIASDTGGWIGDWYTFFDRNGDVSVGMDNIKLYIPPWPGKKQYIDNITINYIPVQ